ncbi:MAG: IMP dehydrogenase [Myxococcales bacterium]|nr:IMP dehydrogenase [Myxococcales bacterium]USN51278.1 MAG: IMP dehydrogenase [Myxococcales bacterium]
MKFEIPQAFTFSDVSLIPHYSEILPSEVDIKINLAQKLTLNAPIMSAAMDTVTTASMAIAMAQVGGLGIIHKNMSIGKQAQEVYRVKKYEAWVINNPITITPDATIAQAKALVKEQCVSGFPVVSSEGELLGMLTARDIRFAERSSHLVRDVMSRDLVIARQKSDTNHCLSLMKQKRVEKLPLVDEENKLTGLVTIKDIHKAFTFPDAVRDQRGRLCCGAALGCTPDLEERAHALVQAGADVLVIDAAHGHSMNVGRAVQQLRTWFKEHLIIAGNVVTKEGAQFLSESGADAVKVGVGPGSICTTRVVAGVGIPQLSAIMSIGFDAKKRGYSVIADGGLQFSGDITKALAAGAHAVMTGSLLAGTKEAPGERLFYGGREFKVYRGMGSTGAMREGSKDRYGQSQVEDAKKLVPEGIEGRIPYRGSVSETIFQLMGGLRAGMGYLGASSIDELQKNAQFIRVTPAGLREGHVHDITITKEASNYNFQD